MTNTDIYLKWIAYKNNLGIEIFFIFLFIPAHIICF